MEGERVFEPSKPPRLHLWPSSFHSSKEIFMNLQLCQVPIQSFARVLRTQSRGLKLNVKAVQM